MSINLTILSGNLTRTPELRTLPGGSDVLNFGLAVNDRRKNPQTGEWEDYPNFVDCAIFGNRARALMPYLAKGTKVCVQGRLRYNSWEQDGERRSKVSVVVTEVELMSRRDGGVQAADPAVAVAQAASAAASAPVAAVPDQAPPPADVYDEDIPF